MSELDVINEKIEELYIKYTVLSYQREHWILESNNIGPIVIYLKVLSLQKEITNFYNTINHKLLIHEKSLKLNNLKRNIDNLENCDTTVMKYAIITVVLLLLYNLISR